MAQANEEKEKLKREIMEEDIAYIATTKFSEEIRGMKKQTFQSEININTNMNDPFKKNRYNKRESIRIKR